MATKRFYIIGFLLSIFLTLAAYVPVLIHVRSHHQTFSHASLILWLLVLAVAQFCVQLVFFLHLHKGPDREWNSVIFFSTISIVLILVVGSIWIMNHLNYNMTPQEINHYIYEQG